MKKHASFAAALALLASFAIVSPVKAEGIDCSKASTYVEKMICSNPEIKAQDDTMAKLYIFARVSMFGKGPSGEIAAQKKWAAERQTCLALGLEKRISCVLNIYKVRNLELAFATMPKAPEAALQVLHDQKIEVVPAYEALTIFASEPDGTNWWASALASKRERIQKLIEPVFNAIQAEGDADLPNKHFSTELLLKNSAVNLPNDVLRSSSFFAGFFRAATFDASTPLPCGYVVSHPALIDATDPYFGATPDNFIIQSNCDLTSPPTPKFKNLQTQIWDHWPECGGTIRFAAYRTYNVTVDKVLAPSARLIENYVTPPPPKAGDEHTLEGVSKLAIKNAEQEMAAYYVKYLGAKPAKAMIFAKGKIADVLNAGQQCE